MGLTISLLSLASIQVTSDKIVGLAKDIEALARSISYSVDNGRMSPRRISLKRNSSSIKPVSGSCNEGCCEESSFRNWEAKRVKLETEIIDRSRNQKLEEEDSNLESQAVPEVNYTVFSPELVSPRPRCELDAAATKMQKAYKGYRTRRNLADCAVVVEELWWKALDFASLKRSSISFFKNENQETAISRWARARTRAAKVGKGLSKSNNAQKLALQHWLEAIDPRHRYGHNLHLYYDVWFKSESTQPFFYWLDVGDGKEVHLEKCPRNTLQNQSIQYLGPNERKAYEVIVENRKLVYRQSKLLLNTNEGSKWIFVLSTLRVFYVGKKKKGKFQHSSFLAGGAITAAGRLIVKDGILKAIWPYSGHYLPTEEHFKEFINFLEDANVDLSHVKRCAVNDDEYPSFKHLKYGPEKELQDGTKPVDYHTAAEAENLSDAEEEESSKEPLAETFSAQSDARLPCNWTTGAWPRIGCVRDYPTNLQCKALEQVNLSPRGVVSGACENMDPIPSPRPCPQLRLSPRLAYMGIPTPKSPLHFSKQR